MGSPTGRATAAPAPKVEPPAPTTKPAAPESPAQPAASVPKPSAPELPAREPAARTAASPELPARAAPRIADMPAREAPRVSQKELPALSPSSPPASSAPKAGPAVAAREVAPPPSPLGRPTGVAHGAGAVASVEGDFPFQWYLNAVQRKVHEQWVQPLSSLQGQKAVIAFEIARSGEVSRARVEKTSGDVAYDLAALRAVTAANPLPPLPADFKGTVIRVHFGFEYTGRG